MTGYRWRGARQVEARTRLDAEWRASIRTLALGRPCTYCDASAGQSCRNPAGDLVNPHDIRMHLTVITTGGRGTP